MKRSEMLKILKNYFNGQFDYYNNSPKQNVEILLKVIEKAGMLPPQVHKINHLTHRINDLGNMWEPEDEKK